MSSVEISASHIGLALGESIQLVTSINDSAGKPLSDRTIVWSSSHPGIITIASGGIATAIAAGLSRITATTEGKVGSIVLAGDAEGPLTAARVSCSGVWYPETPLARRLILDAEVIGSPYAIDSFETIFIPGLLSRGGRIVYRYQNFPRVRVAIDRDSVLALRTSMTLIPFSVTGAEVPNPAKGGMIISYSGSPDPIIAEVIRLGGEVTFRSDTNNWLAAIVEDSTFQVLRVFPAVTWVGYDFTICAA